MALSQGTRLGPYEVLTAIGAGGGACGRGERAQRVDSPRRGGGAPRYFSKQTDLAHAGARRWR